MAITSYAAMPVPRIVDPVTFKEAAALFAETPYPVSANTLVRWVKEAKVPTERVGKTDYVSYSELLVLHGRRFPAP